MQRIPLSSAAHAAALVAVGFRRDGIRVEAMHHTGTGEKRLSWHLEAPNAQDAADLLKRAHSDKRKALWRSDPAHPFLAALAGALNLEALLAWRENPTDGISAALLPGKKIVHLSAGARPIGEDLLRQVPVQYAHATGDLPIAAALIAVGFLPRPTFTGQGNVVLPMESILYPEINAALAVEAATTMRTKGLEVLKLPGPFAAGMHPFQYAFAAAHGLASAPAIRTTAAKKPTLFFREQKSAVVGADALNRPGFEEKLTKHLAGLPV